MFIESNNSMAEYSASAGNKSVLTIRMDADGTPQNLVSVRGDTGSVGIGTTNPTAKLTIEGGNIGIDGNSSAQQFFGAAGNVAGTNTSGGVITVFGHSPNPYGDVSTPPYNGSSFVGAAGFIARGFSESAQYRGSLEFFTETANAPASRMIITHDGNVGIGTTSPAMPLHVMGNVAREVARFQGSVDVSNNRNFVSIYTTNPGYWWELSNQDSAGNGTTNGLSFRERSAGGNSLERVYFAQGGNVGIGTTTPSHKLAVKGTIRANEVIVDTGWADYVFDSNYRLAPLSEVEAHIKTEKHLPGIPSAAEIAEHGVSMGDMQSKLLSKIEELTLHMIQQEKEIATLRQQVGELKAATNQ
jgi:hypothetical protein